MLFAQSPSPSGERESVILLEEEGELAGLPSLEVLVEVTLDVENIGCCPDESDSCLQLTCVPSDSVLDGC